MAHRPRARRQGRDLNFFPDLLLLMWLSRQPRKAASPAAAPVLIPARLSESGDPKAGLARARTGGERHAFQAPGRRVGSHRRRLGVTGRAASRAGRIGPPSDGAMRLQGSDPARAQTRSRKPGRVRSHFPLRPAVARVPGRIDQERRGAELHGRELPRRRAQPRRRGSHRGLSSKSRAVGPRFGPRPDARSGGLPVHLAARRLARLRKRSETAEHPSRELVNDAKARPGSAIGGTDVHGSAERSPSFTSLCL
jgi:hypothetical protein